MLASVLVAQALDAEVEGVTLLGGEPFEQAEGLARFASTVKRTGLSVMTFTGHELPDLQDMATRDNHVKALLDATDLLVDGPYVAGQPDLARPWVGSTNQRFHFLTDRYRHLETGLTGIPDRLEVRVSTGGTVSVNGWATVEQLDALLAPSTGRSPKRGRIR